MEVLILIGALVSLFMFVLIVRFLLVVLTILESIAKSLRSLSHKDDK